MEGFQPDNEPRRPTLWDQFRAALTDEDCFDTPLGTIAGALCAFVVIVLCMILVALGRMVWVLFQITG